MDRTELKILCVAGARPNFVKIAPLMRAFKKHDGIKALLVHTGQHYDHAMSAVFFDELGIPPPDANLGVGSGTHATQTAGVMTAFEPALAKYEPDAVLVVGDVNSTIACGLVAAKAGVPLVHVESGLRSFDRAMPEEINRVLTDAISTLHFCTEQSGVDHLLREGVHPKGVHLVGNVMIDSLFASRNGVAQSTILESLGIHELEYSVLTLHRPSNVDDPRVMSQLMEAIKEARRSLPVVMPVHPRTAATLESLAAFKPKPGLHDAIGTPPMGYLDFQRLIKDARVVLTDSGGIQEETTALGVPCLTLRESTERPVTVTHGSNRLIGTSTDAIVEAFHAVMDSDARVASRPPLWDGCAAERIAEICYRELPRRSASPQGD